MDTVLSSAKQVVIDSFERKGDPGSNVGYPAKPNETAYYLAAIKKATPSVSEDELKVLAAEIKKAAGK